MSEPVVAGLTLTSDMFTNLTSTITSNLGVLLPVGLTLMGIMIAVSLIPRIIYKFFQTLKKCPKKTHFNAFLGHFLSYRIKIILVAYAFTMKKFVLSFIFMFFLIVLGNTNVFANSDIYIPTKVYNKAVELNYNIDNVVILYNSKTNELYIPYQSNYNSYMDGHPWSVTTYDNHFILVNSCWDFMGLCIYNFDSDEFHNADYWYYTGKNSSLILDDSNHPLEVIYSTYNIYSRSNWKDVYFSPNNNYRDTDLVYFDTYVGEVSSLPNVLINILNYILPFCIGFFVIMLVVFLVKKVLSRFQRGLL